MGATRTAGGGATVRVCGRGAVQLGATVGGGFRLHGHLQRERCAEVCIGGGGVGGGLATSKNHPSHPSTSLQNSFCESHNWTLVS